MKNQYVIETANELVELLTTNISIQNDLPDVSNIRIVFENNYRYVRISGTPDYILHDKISGHDVISALFDASGINVYIT